jgi:hypothetical protein
MELYENTSKVQVATRSAMALLRTALERGAQQLAQSFEL